MSLCNVVKIERKYLFSFDYSIIEIYLKLNLNIQLQLINVCL